MQLVSDVCAKPFNAGRIMEKSPARARGTRYIAKQMTDPVEKIRAYRLRNSVFCQELGWVPERADQLEIDAYDEHAVFMGVSDAHRDLMAFCRVVMPGHTFMLQREFSDLIGENHRVRKEGDTAEISRLCLAKHARTVKSSSNFGVSSISMLLYRAVYQLCLNQKIRYLYLVVEEKVFRMLRAKGFPCKVIGEPKVMPDGVIALAAIIDLREFEQSSRISRPRMYSWFRQHQSDLPLTQSLQREFGSQRRVFS